MDEDARATILSVYCHCGNEKKCFPNKETNVFLQARRSLELNSANY